MGIRDRIPRLQAQWRVTAEERAARAEAVAAVQGWNARLAEGREAWVSPSIRAALVAGYPWLTVYCPGCHTSRTIDIRTIDPHPLASVGGLVLGLRCNWCRGDAPMPRLLGGLHTRQPHGLNEN